MTNRNIQELEELVIQLRSSILGIEKWMNTNSVYSEMLVDTKNRFLMSIGVMVGSVMEHDAKEENTTPRSTD